MTDTLAIALAQLNPTVGDLEGNKALILACPRPSRGPGHGPRGLHRARGDRLPARGPRPQADVPGADAGRGGGARGGDRGRRAGAPHRRPLGRRRQALQRGAAARRAAQVAARRYKYELPNYGVFDEVRVFARAGLPGPIPFRGVRLGAMVCEDLWFPEVTECLAESGAEIMIAINGSPFESDKGDRPPQPRRGAHRRDRPAADLREPGGRAGRAGLRRRLLRARRRPWPLRPGARPSRRRSCLPAGRGRSDGWHCAARRFAPTLPEGMAASYRAMTMGLADYVGQERLPRRADRAFRRDRFGAHGRRRRRCAGRGRGPLRRHAVALHRAILPRRRGGMRAPARRPLRDGGDRACGGCARRDAGAALRRPRGGRDRGEHPGAGARRHPHGDQQQARPHGAHHRQQVGDVGGLRHALRRHVRRLFRAEGRLQERRVRAGAPGATRAGPPVSRDRRGA